MTGVFAGSFCPITKGHVDAIERAAKMVDKLYVVVGVNVEKHYALSTEQRVRLVRKALAHLPNVQVEEHGGLMVDFCKQVGATVMIKSIRNAADVQYALDISDATQNMWQGVTAFVVGDKRYRYISSSLVRELAHFGKDISQLVPENCAEEIAKLLG